jgi:hypothetical protein
MAYLFDGLELDREDLGPAREAAEVLIDALWREHGFRPAGIQIGLNFVRRKLVGLNEITADRRRHPEISRERIVAPIAIAGPPRSGTTFLHSLLSQDPAFRAPLAWEMARPSPPPEAATYDTDPRIEQWEQANRAPSDGLRNTVANKDFAAKHLMGARLPEECGGMFTSSVRNMDVYATTRVQPFCSWYLYADQRPAFEVHRKWLQHFQWRNPRERWLLKYPNYGFTIAPFFETYPDAVMVQTHRDPRETISSISSLIGTLREIAFEAQDPFALGVEMVHYGRIIMSRPLAYRQANPSARVVDVSYAELVRAPLATVERLYRTLGIDMSDEAHRRMSQFIADNPQGKHGAHHHNLDQYGLSEGLLREQLAEYYEAYGAMFE